jgi:hypothetical protein
VYSIVFLLPLIVALGNDCVDNPTHQAIVDALFHATDDYADKYLLARRCIGTAGADCGDVIESAYRAGAALEAVLGYFRNGVPKDLCTDAKGVRGDLP